MGDYKEDLIPLSERMSRIKKLQHSLDLLGKHLASQRQTLDAVVVSGDVSLANEEAGFQMLSTVLGRLGSALPEPSNIIVVPGNHDVAWTTPPSSDERYKNFVQHVRSQAYTTPMLDGVDKSLAGIDSLLKHVVVDQGLRWAIIPVNSANYCGSLASTSYVTDDQWSAWATKVDGHTDGPAAKAIRQLRLRDMPRITPWQFGNLSEIVRHLDAKALEAKIPGGIRKIVVVHHQLLPVSDEEEVKPYESFVSLGLLRSFLADHKVDILLHGHKHVDHVYRDAIALQTSQTSHEVVVISGGTIGMGSSSTHACRLVELDLDLPTAPRVRIANIPGLSPGRVLREKEFPTTEFELWTGAKNAGSTAPVQINGESVRETYERIQATFRGLGSSDRVSIVCTVNNPSDAAELPPSYPEVSGVTNRQEWLKGIVDWWQLKGSKVGQDRLHFTHGERIYKYGGDVDQLKNAVAALRNGDTNARAVIALLNPIEDQSRGGRWPSFCLVQFVVRAEERTRYLDAIAYFRHQEMAYWWPVNIAEIAAMQACVQRSLGAKSPVMIGRITTISPLAHSGRAPTFVAVPEMDRIFDANETSLWSMVYALVWADIPNRTDFKAQWISLLNNLVPEEHGDPMRAPVSIRGLGYVLDTLRQFIRHHSSPSLETLADALEQILAANKGYFDAVLDSKADQQQHHAWRGQVKRAVDRALAGLSNFFPESQAGS